jgi:hypothetical protein
LRCDDCGAAVSFKIEAQAPRCRFCNATMHVEVPTDPIERAELMVPFSVTRDRAKESIRSYLSSLGWFRPPDLAARSTIDGITPLWFASWVFEADADVTWAADSDAGSGRSDWAPHAGRRRMGWKNLVVSASRGLTYKEVAALASAYDLGFATPVEEEKLTEVESFDVERSAARRTIIDAIHRTAADELTRGTIPGRRFRNVHVSALLRGLVTRRFALPAYVLAYRYDGRVYRAIVHGQDDRVAFGDAPYSWRRIALLAFGVLAVVAFVAWMIGRSP